MNARVTTADSALVLPASLAHDSVTLASLAAGYLRNLPAFAGLLPGIGLRAAVALVPEPLRHLRHPHPPRRHPLSPRGRRPDRRRPPPLSAGCSDEVGEHPLAIDLPVVAVHPCHQPP